MPLPAKSGDNIPSDSLEVKAREKHIQYPQKKNRIGWSIQFLTAGLKVHLRSKWKPLLSSEALLSAS